MSTSTTESLSLSPFQIKAPLNFLKSWEKVAFIITALAVSVLIILSFTLPMLLPFDPLFLQVGSSFLLAIDLLIFGTIKYVRSKRPTTFVPADTLNRDAVKLTTEADLTKKAEANEQSHILRVETKDNGLKELEETKVKAFEKISQLPLPETEQEALEITEPRFIPKGRWEDEGKIENETKIKRWLPVRPYSKELLRSDIEKVIVQETNLKKAKEWIEKMVAALPFHLGTEVQTHSDFPITGIPNYHGNNCFFNSALQALTHSRFCDYALLRPLTPPIPVAQPEEPIQPILRTVIKPDFPSHLQIEELKIISREYDAEKELAQSEYDSAMQKYMEARKNFWGLKEKYNKYIELEKTYLAACAVQKMLLEIVEELRSGKAPTKQKVEEFFKAASSFGGFGINNGRSGGGEVTDIFEIVSYFSLPRYALTVMKGERAKTVQYVNETSQLPVIVSGSGIHLVAYVMTQKSIYRISDLSVSKETRSYKEIATQIDNQSTCEPLCQMWDFAKSQDGSRLPYGYVSFI